jgi:hypothetical protein
VLGVDTYGIQLPVTIFEYKSYFSIDSYVLFEELIPKLGTKYFGEGKHEPLEKPSVAPAFAHGFIRLAIRLKADSMALMLRGSHSERCSQ